jgi:hypothetical protein
MSMSSWVRVASLALCGVLALAGAGCRDRKGDLLVVTSADCQGYIEPCG